MKDTKFDRCGHNVVAKSACVLAVRCRWRLCLRRAPYYAITSGCCSKNASVPSCDGGDGGVFCLCPISNQHTEREG